MLSQLGRIDTFHKRYWSHRDRKVRGPSTVVTKRFVKLTFPGLVEFTGIGIDKFPTPPVISGLSEFVKLSETLGFLSIVKSQS